LPRPALGLNPPHLAFQVARITDLSHQRLAYGGFWPMISFLCSVLSFTEKLKANPKTPNSYQVALPN
jgi:hypothetical protein